LYKQHHRGNNNNNNNKKAAAVHLAVSLAVINKAAINQAAAVHLVVSLSHSKTYLAEETGNRQAQFFFLFI
jgi:hypothetical protein